MICSSVVCFCTYRGLFTASSAANGGGDHPPDTFLSVPGFSKVLSTRPQISAQCKPPSQCETSMVSILFAVYGQ